MVPISTELFNVSLLKTVSPIIKTINSKTERALKYPHPYTKVMLDNTAKISALLSAKVYLPRRGTLLKVNNGNNQPT